MFIEGGEGSRRRWTPHKLDPGANERPMIFIQAARSARRLNAPLRQLCSKAMVTALQHQEGAQSAMLALETQLHRRQHPPSQALAEQLQVTLREASELLELVQAESESDDSAALLKEMVADFVAVASEAKTTTVQVSNARSVHSCFYSHRVHILYQSCTTIVFSLSQQLTWSVAVRNG